MTTHWCNYCLKPIATPPGVKHHIAQSAHCQHQWKEEFEKPPTISDNEKNHHIDSMHHEPPKAPENWHYKSDGGAALLDKALNLQEGLFVWRHHSLEEAEIAHESNMWAPFHNEEEWELACFLMKNVGQTRMDDISFNTAWSFLRKVDGLCTRPAWTCEIINVVGDIISKDDPVECVEELISNPAFQDVMAYVPEHAYADAKGEKRIYDEMWTGEWWWDVQMKLPKGAVVAPVILSSDKTSLSMFSGDKVWLVYLTIGNISKDVRRQVSAHTTVLIGYLPVSKLKCFQKKTHSLAGYWLFHRVMSLVLQPLIDVGRRSKEMVCADGYLHRVHPILAAYVANFPEQCLVACSKESCCPCCFKSDKHGDLEECAWNKQSRKFYVEGLRVVYKPFWKDLPFSDIFTCITPNILHQLHKGIFHDHLLQWCTSLMSEKEIDTHFWTVNHYPALCHFKKGISTISQWTSTKHKEMQHVFVGLLSGVVEDKVLVFQQHTDMTLKAMQESLKMFHNYKHILVELEVCQDFNLPKLHSLQHYITSIQALGSANGYNTEYPKWLHIDSSAN
ncbi:hypothetical protein F5141DRAFT_1187665 [Pisolithus sp. B1]|nr:hypothetical protein F5141DRAFT_1187665 [Pisolithus sp. B1]